MTQPSDGEWYGLPLGRQLARVGRLVDRALKWQEKGRPELCLKSANWALELLRLIIEHPDNADRARELSQARDVLADYFLGDNLCRTTPALLRGWFRAIARRA